MAWKSRRVVLPVFAAGVLGALAITVATQSPAVPALTFGLTPTTSTINYSAPLPYPNPYRDPPSTAFSLWSGRAFSVADFNNDGLLDIAIAPSYLSYQPKLTFQFWLNQGDGRFADGTADVMDGPAVEFAGWPYVADFNRDGRTDVFLAGYGLEDKPATVGFDGEHSRILLSQPNGRLRDMSETHLPGDPVENNHPSNMADINGDGAMDMVLQRLGGIVPTGGQGTALVMNDGTGRFTQTTAGLPREIAYMVRSEASRVLDRQLAGTVGACDFDGNGRVDLVTASYLNTAFPRNVRMYEQSATGQFTERFRIPLPQAIVDLAAARTPRGVGAAGLTCQDLNGDGLGDVAIHWETFSAFTYIQFLKNVGGFRFEDVTLDWFGTWETFYPVRNGFSATMGLQFRDLNGDGTPDFYPMNAGQFEASRLWDVPFAYLNDGTGHFRPVVYQPTNPSVTSSTLANALACPVFCGLRPLLFDATGDGVTDLVLIETWTLRNPGPPPQEGRVLIHVLEGSVTRGGATAMRRR